jgi:ABC-2 type transport system permease protein
MIHWIRTTMRATYRNVAIVLTWLSLTISFAAVAILLVNRLLIREALSPAGLESYALANYLMMATYAATFLGCGLHMNVFTAGPLIREKRQRTLESVLATPIEIGRMWTARSLAVFIPSMIIGAVIGLISFLIWNGQLVAGGITVSIPAAGFVSAFAVVPLVYLALSFLAQLIGLIGDAVGVNVISSVFFPAVLSPMSNLAGRQTVPALSWLFVLIHVALAATLGIATLLLKSKLTKERIVLSSRR